MNKWSVYLLRCVDGSLYCGVTNNLQNRVYQHNRGKGAKYTRARRPVALVAWKSGFNKRDAYRMEYKIKHLPKIKKIPFIKVLNHLQICS